MAQVATPPGQLPRPQSRLPVSSLSRSRSVLAASSPRYTTSASAHRSPLPSLPMLATPAHASQISRPPTTLNAKLESARQSKSRIHTRSVSVAASSRSVSLESSRPVGATPRSAVARSVSSDASRVLQPAAQNRQTTRVIPTPQSTTRGPITRSKSRMQTDGSTYLTSTMPRRTPSAAFSSVRSYVRRDGPQVDETPIKTDTARHPLQRSATAMGIKPERSTATATPSTGRRIPVGPRRPLLQPFIKSQEEDSDATPRASAMKPDSRNLPSRSSTLRRPMSSMRVAQSVRAAKPPPLPTSTPSATPLGLKRRTVSRTASASTQQVDDADDATPRASAKDVKGARTASNPNHTNEVTTPRPAPKSESSTTINRTLRKVASGTNLTPLGPRRSVSRSSAVTQTSMTVSRASTVSRIRQVSKEMAETPVRQASAPKAATVSRIQQRESQPSNDSTTPVRLPHKRGNDVRPATVAAGAGRVIPESKSLRPPATPIPRSQSQARFRTTASHSAARPLPSKTAAATAADVTPRKPSTDLGKVLDPFNRGTSTSLELLKLIQSARRSGHLDLSGFGIESFPEEVYDFLDLETERNMSARRQSLVFLKQITAKDNKIERLDERLCTQFIYLEVLNLHDNLLRKLPYQFSGLQHLTALDLSKCRLTNESLSSIFKLTSLTTLDLHGNRLDGELPASISILSGLSFLDLSDNEFTSISNDALGGLVSLEVLRIKANKLKAFPFESIENGNLTELDISYNKLAGSLISTARISRFSELRVLRASHNQIKVVSEFAIILPALEVLDLFSNRITSLGMLLLCTPSLTHLLLGRNMITETPEGVEGLSGLHTLDISHNSLSKLSSSLGLIDSLEVLKWEGNKFAEKSFTYLSTKDIKFRLRARLEKEKEAVEVAGDGDFDSEELIELMVQKRKTRSQAKAKTVDLSGREYSEIPQDVIEHYMPGGVYRFGSEAASELNLSRNRFSSIPDTITKFAFADALRVVDLSFNMLDEEAFNCPISLRSLAELNLSNNSIGSLFMLAANCQFPQLQKLNLSFNKIEEVPSTIVRSFATLEELNLHENRISEIWPDSFRGLAKIDLSNNAIGYLPPELGKIKSLVELKVLGNTFKTPRLQVVEKGTEALLEWLRLRLPDEEV